MCSCAHRAHRAHTPTPTPPTHNVPPKKQRHYDGLQAQGGYSSHIVNDERYTYRLPASVPLHRAAPLLCAGITP